MSSKNDQNISRFKMTCTCIHKIWQDISSFNLAFTAKYNNFQRSFYLVNDINFCVLYVNLFRMMNEKITTNKEIKKAKKKMKYLRTNP